ncbi:MAG: LemA family protein [Gammaproteobacteria bacterium]|nr:LemA family protein [Gammaproteobacteria bacterium]
MSAVLILLVPAGLIILYGVLVYNRFIKDRNTIDEAWSGIDVQLRQRHNLIPNLVETVKGYASHEAGVLEKVTAQRGAGSMADVNRQENRITGALVDLFAVAEDYPDLKASANFADLQQELSRIEDHIQLARRYYNGAVREYNTRVQSFPSNLVAWFFRFTERDFFEIKVVAQRELPEVAL